MVSDISKAQQMVRDLRDSDSHLCPANDNEHEPCSCREYDNLIDFLETLKKKL